MIGNKNINEEDLKDEQILLNGEILTKGILSVELISNIEHSKIGIGSQEIYIKGALKTNYYIKELDEIESVRYYVRGVFVTKEAYNSLTNEISYEFEAQYFQPKFQDTDYERISKQ